MKFNTLRHGEPEDVVSELEDEPATEQELRAALQNAFARIDRLARHIEMLRGDIDPKTPPRRSL